MTAVTRRPRASGNPRRSLTSGCWRAFRHQSDDEHHHPARHARARALPPDRPRAALADSPERFVEAYPLRKPIESEFSTDGFRTSSVVRRNGAGRSSRRARVGWLDRGSRSAIAMAVSSPASTWWNILPRTRLRRWSAASAAVAGGRPADRGGAARVAARGAGAVRRSGGLPRRMSGSAISVRAGCPRPEASPQKLQHAEVFVKPAEFLRRCC